MKIHFDCIPCFIRQALDAARFLELSDEVTSTLLRRTLGLAQELDWSLPPPVIGRDIHRAIREITGNPDPYQKQKVADTKKALELLPAIRRLIEASDDPFLSAVKFSIAGNAIDLGAMTAVDADVHKSFEGALDEPIDRAAVDRLREAIAGATSILFLADNSGELVFDRPLLERIGRNKVTVAVRGAPVINDATVRDAERSGITERFRVIPNGSDTPGTWLEDCSPAFVEAYDGADLVIAKGQGNYEALNDQTRKIVFLFLVKCRIVADGLGVPAGTYAVCET